MGFLKTFSRRRKRQKSSVKKIVNRPNLKKPLVISKAKKSSDFSKSKTLKNIPKSLVRLETIKKVNYENKNLVKKNIPRGYTAKDINFNNEDSVCKKRRRVRREILAKTKGKGLKIKKAVWSPDSYIQCRG